MDLTNKFSGFAKVRVLAINPDKDWIEENLGEVLEEEPTYTFEMKRKRCAKIEVYMETVDSTIFKYDFIVTDEEKTGKNNSYQYINSLGATQWAQSEDQLWDSFKFFEEILSWNNGGVITKKYSKGAKPHEKEIIGSKQIKVAVEGEPELLHLIKMIEQPNMYNPDVNLFVDLEKLYNGDFSTLQNMVRTTVDFHFTAFMYLSEKLEQKVWKEFFKVEMIRELPNVSKYSKKIYEDWLKNLEFGCKGYYILDKLKPMKEEFVNMKEITEDGGDF